jgi:hypothetical protein
MAAVVLSANPDISVRNQCVCALQNTTLTISRLPAKVRMRPPAQALQSLQCTQLPACTFAGCLRV